MGLYLCVFASTGEELDGVEVGSYADFDFFRDAVRAVVENGVNASSCPVLQNHSDCDGEWSSAEAALLKAELRRISDVMSNHPAIEHNSKWKNEVARTMGLNPHTLLECFFDVDGEPLVDRLIGLCQVSVDSGYPIVFQ
jgi:Immunity protein 70